VSLTFRKQPKRWGTYNVYDGPCLLGTVTRDPGYRTWRALPSDAGGFLPGRYPTRAAAATALVR
jgi:hypothetical protein